MLMRRCYAEARAMLALLPSPIILMLLPLRFEESSLWLRATAAHFAICHKARMRQYFRRFSL